MRWSRRPDKALHDRLDQAERNVAVLLHIMRDSMGIDAAPGYRPGDIIECAECAEAEKNRADS